MIEVVTIHKDQPEYLYGMLLSTMYKDVIEKVIVLDTGSSGENLERVYSYKDRFNFDLHIKKFDSNDLSEMRNEALGYATAGNYFLSLDCDERLEILNPRYLQQNLLNTSDITNWLVNIRHWHMKPNGVKMFHRERILRLAKNENVIWKSAIHEFLGSRDGQKHRIGIMPERAIRIMHLGYDVSRDEIINKIRRYGKALVNALERDPSNPHYWQYLAKTFGMFDDPINELMCLKRAMYYTENQDVIGHIKKRILELNLIINRRRV